MKAHDILRRLWAVDKREVLLIDIHNLMVAERLVYPFQRKNWLNYLLVNKFLIRDESNDQVYIINRMNIAKELGLVL